MSCRVCEAECRGAFMCRGCGAELERAIGDMPALLAELETTIARQDRVYRAAAPKSGVEPPEDPEGHLHSFLRSSGGRIALRASALPVNLGAVETRWEVWNTLTSWVRHLCESRGVPEADRPGDRGVVGFLLANVESFRFDEAAAEAFDEITFAHRQAEQAIDRSPERIYAGPCRAVDPVSSASCVRDLYGFPGSEVIMCDGHRSQGDEGCRYEHTWADRRDWLRAGVEDMLLPLDSLTDCLPFLIGRASPPSDAWRQWQQRGRLLHHGRDVLGRKLFRGGDVLDLAFGYKAREKAS